MPVDNRKDRKDTIKKLFIISPIGERESKDRIYFNKVKRHIIDPVAVEKGYETKRADSISRPGRITKQIIERLRNDDLIVADLTRKNPNVFYELAVRHAVGKPVILMATIGEKIPFDVSAQRVIFYDLDPDNIAASKEELSKQISEVGSATFIVDSPIEAPIAQETMKKSIPLIPEIVAILRNQSRRLRNIEENLLEQPSRERHQERILESVRGEEAREMYTIALSAFKFGEYTLRLSDWYKEMETVDPEFVTVRVGHSFD